MSQENGELVKAFMVPFEAGDRDAWRDYFDPDVVWDTSASEMPAAGIYHGHEGVERFFGEWLGAWDEYEIETHEYVDAGDSVVHRVPPERDGSRAAALERSATSSASMSSVIRR